MENKDLISIIVPVYKVEKYIKKCVDSIVNQTYTNLEIILIDDGSPDNCPKILDDYAKKDKKIIVIHKSNGGLSDARNVGLDIAKGKYIAFVDSDDYVEEDYIEKMYNALITNNADMTICNIRNIDEDDNEIEYKSPIKNEILTPKEYFSKTTMMNYFYYVVSWNKLYSRKAIGNIKFPIGKYHEDEFTSYKFSNNCEKICVIEDKLYNYLRRKDSISGQKTTIGNVDIVEALIERINFYINNNYFEFIDPTMNLLLSNYFNYKNIFYKDYKDKFNELEDSLKEIINNSKKYLFSYNVLFKVYFPFLYILLIKLRNNE